MWEKAFARILRQDDPRFVLGITYSFYTARQPRTKHAISAPMSNIYKLPSGSQIYFRRQWLWFAVVSIIEALPARFAVEMPVMCLSGIAFLPQWHVLPRPV